MFGVRNSRHCTRNTKPKAKHVVLCPHKNCGPPFCPLKLRQVHLIVITIIHNKTIPMNSTLNPTPILTLISTIFYPLLINSLDLSYRHTIHVIQRCMQCQIQSTKPWYHQIFQFMYRNCRIYRSG